jgi:hypothetical protein
MDFQRMLKSTDGFSRTLSSYSIATERNSSKMPQADNAIRNRKTGLVQDKKVMFVLHQELLDQIREVADANHISVSHFLRESARRNIAEYKRAGP